MKVLATLFLASAATTGAGRSGSRQASGAAHRHLAHLQRRLFRPPLQYPLQNQRVQHQLSQPRLGLPRQRRARRPWWRRLRRPHLRHPRRGQRRPLLHHARPRLGRRRAHRPRSLALPLDVHTAAIHIGNRGVGVYGNWLYFETPDCNLVSLNLKDGKERWHKPICDLDQYYFGSMAPLVVKNHVITGVSGDDLDRPGYLESRDPETGDLQWRWYAVPQKMGDPGSETWPNEEAMQHGGGMTWLTPTYDPELNLIYVPTGNPQPVIAGKARPGANLFTASVVALNPDTGKMQWYFQSSPHDTHDWDATQTPVLFDGEINGQKRKLLAQASRNGYFFVLDRATGKNISSNQYVKVNWSKGVDAKGPPIPDPAKEPQLDGALVSPNQGGATNWPPPTYNPRYRPLLCQRVTRLQRLLHLRSQRQARRLGRQRPRRLGRNRCSRPSTTRPAR